MLTAHLQYMFMVICEPATGKYICSPRSGNPHGSTFCIGHHFATPSSLSHTLSPPQPPAIRLYDLHVRLNMAVKTGVQLLLLEQGKSPEMFRLDFTTKKEAKE